MIRLSLMRMSRAPLLLAAAPLGAQGQSAAAMPVDWWPWAAAGAVGVLVLLGLGAFLRQRRRPKMLRLAPPAADSVLRDDAAPDPARLDLTLDITGATRSVMMFTLEYRLTIANRTARAANDLKLAAALACARRGLANGAAPGAAQQILQVERVGPHQSRSITGTLQLPLSAIAPLRQGQLPLFIPLVHISLDGEGAAPLTRSFVIGTPSTAGRVHPIRLDMPPGSITDLIAQAVAIPPAPVASA